MRNRVGKILVLCLLVVVQVSQASGMARINSGGVRARGTRHTTDRAIRLEIVVNAPVARVWKAWTTPEGIKSFFAPDCDIDVRVLGKYDILFAPKAPAGLRGAEGNLILAMQEGKLLSFTWDAPPHFPDIRKQRTSVVIRFTPVSRNQTKLLFTQSGWGEGEEWDKVYDYFIMAWGEVVLPFLKHSLEVAPIDWQNPPQKLAKATLIGD